jgi:ectoine hydroxylase-related dioxygenase (phytanoyl-CoA dioxygenase family)
MIVHPDLLGCAQRILAPMTTSVLLTVAEYMERRPGQPRQSLHRDTDAWTHLPLGENPVAVTLMCAMSDFTVHNGATWVVLDSHRNPAGTVPDWDDAVQATMSKGDALVFRSDVFHAGGANETAADLRQIFSLGYQVGWLRTVENSTLSVPPAMAATLPEGVQELLGYSAELVLGLYEGAHPKTALTDHVDPRHHSSMSAPDPGGIDERLIAR